ncbi:YeeE/YedE family protein [Altererythrobacter salegens]|uniref:YeeE/YedE family protein n=1 Tax=Croceibacterium salegens TaxID=1737568 RepID=A0A6I4T1D3_9SPHN|nr:YeeE/YedE thiosulfate transporter family protein [Croceibacterium salegens]MXO61278.1 YeeE/YedE family protein [Croceibacterium salegens]
MSGAAIAALAVALLSAALMGLAIQRGATCMVAAVDEALTQRRFGRAGALAEAAIWVGGLVACAQLSGWFGTMPARYAPTGATVAGGVLLGLGAWVNRACVFGSVARIGNGQWGWLATPVGFFLGCLLPISRAEPSGTQLPFAFPGLVALGFVGLLGWRIVETVRSGAPLKHLWHPHRATLLIAFTFVTTMLAVGAWAYTDALAALARPMTVMNPRFALRGVMVAALFAGAILGGRIAGVARWETPKPAVVLRCLSGGAMMGVGAALVPGSNDGLIMLGLPLLLPHAWVAVTAMALTIAAVIWISTRFQSFARA